MPEFCFVIMQSRFLPILFKFITPDKNNPETRCCEIVIFLNITELGKI
jgi:hypothetical protein